MNTSQEIFDELGVNREVVISFILYFSRFEYALKQTGCYAGGNRSHVYADWRNFAEDHNDTFETELDEDVREAAEYLERHPPKRQVKAAGKLDWKEMEFESNLRLRRVLQTVRTVRNNLFHGGKFPTEEDHDPTRDEVLLRHCLTILHAALELSEDVRRHFKNSFLPGFTS